MIIQSIAFFTNEGKGISDIIFLIGDILAGAAFPLPLMPRIIRKVSDYLPFKLIGDLPFRVYSGNISVTSGISLVLLQVIWIIVLITMGQIVMKIALKKVCIQGG